MNKKKFLKKRIVNNKHKKSVAASKNELAGRELLDSTELLKVAGDLLLKAIKSIPENDAELTAAADALIAARSSLISAAQKLANTTERLKPVNKLIPPIAERLKALEYTLN